MKERTRIQGLPAVALLALGLATGCDDAQQDRAEAVSANRVEEETREAVDAIARYGATQRAGLERQAQEARQALESQIDAAQARLDSASDDARARLQAAVDRAERAQRNVAKEIASLKDTTRERWEEARQRMSEAMDEASEARKEIARALEGDSA